MKIFIGIMAVVIALSVFADAEPGFIILEVMILVIVLAVKGIISVFKNNKEGRSTFIKNRHKDKK